MSLPPRKVLQPADNVTDQIHNRGSQKPAPYAAASSSSQSASSNGRSSNRRLGQQPRAPRSAFICFTDAKKKEIMSKNGILKDNDDILNVVALEWKKLSDRDRAHWDEEARNDKVRYVREKAAYKGSWAVKKCRAKKHPLAPKRPMSAFLKFSQTRRQMIKEENPAMENTDISRLLGEMWRNASKQERIPYVEQELKERAIYKEKMKHFREKLAREDAACRSSHQSVQNYQQQPQGYERTYQRIGFENFHIDSFEESTKKGFNQQQQAYPLMPYHQSYPSVSDISFIRNTLLEFHETEPLPLARPPLPPPQVMDDDESIAGLQSGTRSKYFSDNNLSLGHYSRYP